MTGPMPQKKDPVVAMRENLEWLRENGASREDIDAEIRKWSRKITSFNEREALQNDPMGIANRGPVAGNLMAGGRAALEAAATVGAGAPGGRLAQQGFGQLAGESEDDVRAAMDAATQGGDAGSMVGRFAGGMSAAPAMAARAATAGASMLPQGVKSLAQALAQSDAAMIPRTVLQSGIGRAAASGAGYGAADAALTGADVSPEERVAGVKRQAGIGAVTSPLAQALGNTAFAARDFGRALSSPSRGAIAETQATKRSVDAARGYRQSGQEGLVTQGPSRVMGDRQVAPYVDDVTGSPSFQQGFPNPSQQQVLDETYKEIGDQSARAQQGIVAQSGRGTGRVQTGTRRDLADAGVLKERVMEEMDYFSPSYRPTVQEFAAQSGVMEATGDAADATRALVTGKWTPTPKIRTQSAEAFEKAVPAAGAPATSLQFTPRELEGARAGAYAGLKESMIRPFANTEGGWNPLKLFGIGPDVARTFAAGRFLRPLDEAVAGRPLPRPKNLRDALMAGGFGAAP